MSSLATAPLERFESEETAAEFERLVAALEGKLAHLADRVWRRCAAGCRAGAGEGALEQADPSCLASSLIGTTNVGVGVGVPLTYVLGKVYLAGPYRGAPLSILVISPAVVGPYDLGVIAVRTALRVDPETTQVSATTDPFPLIYQGIPVRIRDIRLVAGPRAVHPQPDQLRGEADRLSRHRHRRRHGLHRR